MNGRKSLGLLNLSLTNREYVTLRKIEIPPVTQSHSRSTGSWGNDPAERAA
jgi:hypothetical protein